LRLTHVVRLRATDIAVVVVARVARRFFIHGVAPAELNVLLGAYARPLIIVVTTARGWLQRC
jgi:hypothetical protein